MAPHTVIKRIIGYKIPLTQQGIKQANLARTEIKTVISGSGTTRNRKVFFYMSPYERSRYSLLEIGRSFLKNNVIGVRKECRIREQDFGNFQVAERMQIIKKTRERFGRFPVGESAADVYDRVSSFLESLWRDIDLNRLNHDPADDLNLIIVSHGNDELRVLQLGVGGEYILAVYHSDKEMQRWGMLPEMSADQKWRARATRGEWTEKYPWYLDVFFDDLEPDSDDG